MPAPRSLLSCCTWRALLLASVVVGGFGCSGQTVPHEAADASVAPDSGAHLDAGAPTDAGETRDGGEGPDAGPPCTSPDSDQDGVCDERDPCPASASDDSDQNSICDDVDLCSALAQLRIAPANRQPGDELTAMTGAFPSAILKQATLSYLWTVDGQPTLYSTAVVPANVTRVEEVWDVTADASFNGARASCQGAATASFFTGKPTCRVAALTPLLPFATDTLSCTCTDYVDRNADPEGASTCVFTRGDGAVLPSNPSSSCVLPALSTVRDQTVTCTYTPVDKDGAGYPATSNAVLFLNSPPLLVPVLVSTADGSVVHPADTTKEIFCVPPIDITDVDGDTLSTMVEWTINGLSVDAAAAPAGFTRTPAALFAKLATPRNPARGDEIGCKITVSDGTATVEKTAAPLQIANTPPVITSATVTDAAMGGTFTCSASATDADGDSIQYFYTWNRIGTASGQSGPLSETSSTLVNDQLPRHDRVACTVTAYDGHESTSLTSNEGISLNSAPTARVAITSNAASGRAPDLTSTLACTALDVHDVDGDNFTLTYTWKVNGTPQKTETLAVRTASTLSGVFTKGQTATCSVLLSDGTDSKTLTESVVIGNSLPKCVLDTSPYFPTNDENAYIGCRLDEPGYDLDHDIVSTTCVWKNTSTGQVVSNSCTMSGAESPNDADVTGTVTVTDASGESSSAMHTTFTRSTTATNFTPTATINPSTGVKVSDLDTVFTCSWTPKTDANGRRPYYVPVLRLQNGNLTSDNQTLRQLGLSTPGDQITCLVYDYVSSGIVATSAPVTLQPATGVIKSITSTPSDSVKVGDTFQCNLNYWTTDPISSGLVFIGLYSGASSSGPFSTVLAGNGSQPFPQSSAQFTVPQSAAGQWIACRGKVYPGDNPATTYSNVFSKGVYVAGSAPTISSVEVTPRASQPCDRRACAVVVSDPDADLGFGGSYSVGVTWMVDGVVAGTDSATFANLTPGLNTLEVPMNSVGVAGGSQVSCVASVTKAGLAATTITSPVSHVIGTGPVPQNVSLTAYARIGDPLTCSATVSGSCPNGASSVKYAWYVDGVLQSGTAATLDTSNLVGGQQVQCAVRAGTNGGGFGAPVLSNLSMTAPSSWVMTGASTWNYAGNAISVIGDLNNDGYPEIAVGAPAATANGLSSAGKVYLIPGSGTGGTTDLASIDSGALGGVIWGDSGSWVANDTICRPRTPSISVPCSPSHPGFTDEGDSYGPLGDGLGTRLAAIGDVTGDGIPDLAVSAPYALASGQYLAGRTYVLSGATLGSIKASSIAEAMLLGSSGSYDGEQGVWQGKLWTMNGADYSWDGQLAGFRLAAGDYDGDGTIDVAIAAPNADPADGTRNGGRIYVAPLGDGLTSTSLKSFVTPEADGTYLARTLDGYSSNQYIQSKTGSWFANAGDFDGDGLDDLYVSDTSIWSSNYLVPGSPVRENVVLHKASGTVARKFTGVDGQASTTGDVNLLDGITSGTLDTLSRGGGVGDVNGDGKQDIAIPFIERENNVGQIELAVFFGHSGSGPINIKDPDQGIGGFVVEGRPSGSSTSSEYTVFRAGDVDGDGLDDIALTLTRRTTPSDSRVYVVYGRTSTSTLTLADIEAGSGGFVLSGLAGNVTALEAADLDGDGLSDLLMGIPLANASSDSGTGRVEVWYGRPRAGATVLQGIHTDDVLAGTSGADRIFGGRGNDVLTGDGGADVLYGGSGNDVIAVSSGSFQRVRGGLGNDTLRVDGFRLELASTRGRIESIETIDLGGAGTLAVTAIDVKRLSELTNELIVLGGAGAQLEAVDSGWTYDGTTLVNGVMVRLLVNGKARLLVQEGVGIKVAPELKTLMLSVSELATGGTTVGTLSVFNADGASVTASIASSALGSWFTFDPSTLVLKVAGSSSAMPLDYEATPTLTLPVTLTASNGLSVTTNLVISMLDQNEAPSFAVATPTATVMEAAASGTVVALVGATDPDKSDVLTYAISSGNPNGAFTINTSTGLVTVADGTWLDYEQQAQHVLVVRASDKGGAPAFATLTIDLDDKDAIESSLTLSFVSSNQTVFQQLSGATTPLMFPSASFTQSLATQAGGEDTAFSSSIGTLNVNTQTTGSVTGTTSMSIDWGTVSAYVPMSVGISVPDQITLGTPFSMTTTSSLASSAVMWGNSPGFKVQTTLGFLQPTLNATSQFTTDVLGSTVAESMPIVDLLNNPLKLEVDSKPFQSVLYRDAFPNGPTADSACALFNCGADTSAYTDWATKAGTEYSKAVNFVNHRGYETSFSSAGTFDSFLQKTAYFDGQNHPNMLMTWFDKVRSFELPLTQSQILAALLGTGYTGSTLGPWWAQVTIPTAGGYAKLNWDLWSSKFYFSANVYDGYYLDVSSVTVTMKLEDGTVFSDIPLGTAKQLTFPSTADTNNDGRVDVTFEFKIHNSFAHYMIVTPGVKYVGTTLEMKGEFVRYKYDSSGNKVGEIKYPAKGFGPVSQSEYNYGWFMAYFDRWELPGFQTITGKGSFQIAH